MGVLSRDKIIKFAFKNEYSNIEYELEWKIDRQQNRPGQKEGKPQVGLGQWDERMVQLGQADRISKIS